MKNSAKKKNSGEEKKKPCKRKAHKSNKKLNGKHQQ
jgi:hypothetical protein